MGTKESSPLMCCRASPATLLLTPLRMPSATGTLPFFAPVDAAAALLSTLLHSSSEGCLTQAWAAVALGCCKASAAPFTARRARSADLAATCVAASRAAAALLSALSCRYCIAALMALRTRSGAFGGRLASRPLKPADCADMLLLENVLSANLRDAAGAAAKIGLASVAVSALWAGPDAACILVTFADLLRLYSKACRMRAPTSPPLDVGTVFEFTRSDDVLASCSLPDDSKLCMTPKACLRCWRDCSFMSRMRLAFKSYQNVYRAEHTSHGRVRDGLLQLCAQALCVAQQPLAHDDVLLVLVDQPWNACTCTKLESCPLHS